jgi:hypothetical protein
MSARSIVTGIAAPPAILAAIVVAATARADGVCEKGIRDTTAAERATITDALEAVRAALPPAPEGWVIRDEDEISPPANLCRDVELAPWTYDFARYYTNEAGGEARREAFEAAAAKAQASFEQKQPRLEAVQAKMQELIPKAVEAAQKNDTTQTQKLAAEMAKLQAELESINNEGGTNEQFDAATAELGRDAEISVRVVVNPRISPPADHYVAFSVPGAQSAYRWDELEDNHHDGNALVRFGRFEPVAGSQSLEPVARSGVASPGVHAIEVRIVADVDRLSSVIEATNFEALGVLVR